MKNIHAIDAIVMAPGIANRISHFLKPELVSYLGRDCFKDLQYWKSIFSGHESFDTEEEVTSFVFNTMLDKMDFYRR